MVYRINGLVTDVYAEADHDAPSEETYLFAVRGFRGRDDVVLTVRGCRGEKLERPLN